MLHNDQDNSDTFADPNGSNREQGAVNANFADQNVSGIGATSSNANQPQRRIVQIRVCRNRANRVQRNRDINGGNNSSISNQQNAAEANGVHVETATESSAQEITNNTTQQQSAGNRLQRYTVNNNGITFVGNLNGRQRTQQAETTNNQSQQQVPRILRFPSVTRQIRVPSGVNGVRIAGVTSPIQPSNPNTLPRVNIPKLVPQPIPNKKYATPTEEDESAEKYSCTICCELFTHPSSCGNCSSRFCYHCLKRVASNPFKQAKCPACRAQLTLDGIVQDKALMREMEIADIHVNCPDCGERIKAAFAKDHESSCPHTMMRCKNAIMGCTWHGPRKDLDHHLATHCHVEQIAGLVDQFRHVKADQEAAIISLQQKQFLSNQMVDLNTAWIRKSLPSPYNIFDLMNLIYNISCTPAYFLATADIWTPFLSNHGAQESRAALCNFLYLLPTIFNICRVSIGGYRLMISINFTDGLHLAADQMLLGIFSIIPFILLIASVSCLLMDGQSSLKWNSVKIGKFDRKIMRDIITMALLTANVVVIECDNSDYAASSAVFLWIVTVTATIFFPPVILTVLGLASGISEPNPHQIFCAGRCAVVVSFVLRHAALVGFIGLSPAIDAVLLLQLARKNITFVVCHNLVPYNDGIWSMLGNDALLILLAGRFSIWVLQTQLQEIPVLPILATTFLLVINYVFQSLTHLGIMMGSIVFLEGRKNILPGHMNIRSAFSVNGTTVFLLWSTLLLILAVTF